FAMSCGGPALSNCAPTGRPLEQDGVRVAVSLPLAVRQTQLVDTDTESDPEEAPSEAEESQPLVSSDSIALLSPDHPLTHILPTPTPTRVPFHRRTARMYMRTQPTLSPGMSARIAEAGSLSTSSFRKRYISSYEIPSPSSSSTLLVRKRYRERDSQGLDEEGQGLDDEGQGLEDEGPGIEEEEEAAPEGQQQALLVVDTAVSEPLGLGYWAARRRALESTEEITPSTYEVGQSSKSVPEQEGAEQVSAYRQPTLVTWVDLEDGRVYTGIPTYIPPATPVLTPPSLEWSFGSLPVSPSSPVVSSPIASPVATPAATISVDEDQFLEAGTQLELHGSILHDHMQRLDALPPALFKDYDRDLRELYTRSRTVRDEIFSQRYRFRSLEREHERATRENHDLRRQLAEETREQLELTDRVVRMERRHESGREL
ncbi:hypothetical protein Tco_0389213, partial [Tanacetum coccineum]